MNQPQQNLNQITLNVEDSCFVRARKILQHAGIIEGVGLAARMAEAIDFYRVLDQNKPSDNTIPMVTQEQIDALDKKQPTPVSDESPA